MFDPSNPNLTFVPEIDDSLFIQQLTQMKNNMEKILLQGGKKPNPGVLQNLMMPKGGNMVQGMEKGVKTSFKGLEKQFKGLTQIVGKSGKGLGGFFKSGDDQAKKLENRMKNLINLSNKLGKELDKASGGKDKEENRKQKEGGVWKSTKKVTGMLGRTGLRAGAFLGRGAMGFVTGAYKQGIQSYEQTAAERLAGAPSMVRQDGAFGKKVQGFRSAGYDSRSGAKFGYSADAAARLQAGAAREGMAGVGSGRSAFMLNRALGERGVGWGAALMRQQGTTGGKGSRDAIRQLSQAMAIGVKTGLDEARIGEFLQAGVEYAEAQLKVTPDNNQYKQFIRELGLVQMRGGPGMRGRYGSAALGQVDQAVKGAQGTQQSFLLRAFGMGRGAGFFKSLQRQESGVAGQGEGGESNMMAIMKQLRSEYGAGKEGGLSQSGALAFKGMGFGSTSMAKKFGEIYLQRQSGKLTAKQATEKVKQIQDKEKEAKMPTIQRKAYAVMANFGGVAKMLAGRFNKLSDFGAKNYDLKETITKFQIGMIDTIKPIMDSVKPLVGLITNGLTTVMPTIVSILTKIFETIEVVGSGIGGFISGYSKSDGGLLKRIDDGFTGLGKGWGDASKRVGLRSSERSLKEKELEYKELLKQRSAMGIKGKMDMEKKGALDAKIGNLSETIKELSQSIKEQKSPTVNVNVPSGKRKGAVARVFSQGPALSVSGKAM